WPRPVVRVRFAQLAGCLSQESGVQVRRAVVTHEARTKALAGNRVDFFLSNPSHFLLIRSARCLTGVLATVLSAPEGQSTGSIGGVILARQERDDINMLSDLPDKSIATPGVHYLGGFQSQALELLDAGVDIQRTNRIVRLGNHDRVVRAVLAGDADVGFVRTGIYEELLQENPLLGEALKVINLQELRGYPFVLSTRLYPE